MKDLDRREFLRLLAIHTGGAVLVTACGDDAQPNVDVEVCFHDADAGSDADGGSDGGGPDLGGSDGGGDPSADPDMGSDTVDEPDAVSATLQERLDAARPTAEAFFPPRDPAGVATAGNTYLRVVAPNRTDAELLAVLGSILCAIEASDSVGAVVTALRDRVVDDFRLLRIVDLEGWTLSPTELGLASILALTQSA